MINDSHTYDWFFEQIDELAKELGVWAEQIDKPEDKDERRHLDAALAGLSEARKALGYALSQNIRSYELDVLIGRVERGMTTADDANIIRAWRS